MGAWRPEEVTLMGILGSEGLPGWLIEVISVKQAAIVPLPEACPFSLCWVLSSCC